MIELLDPVSTDKDTDSSPPMIHLFEIDNPTVTLCGQPVTQIVSDDTPVDCIVCHDLAEYDDEDWPDDDA